MPPVLMATGHQHVVNVETVRDGLHDLLTGVPWAAAVSGGGPGSDTLFAEVATEAAVPLTVALPNRYYRDVYSGAIPQRLLDAAEDVCLVVDRPACLDWRRRWKTERWWRDNFERNHYMVGLSTAACVVSAHNPLELLNQARGGTVECVKHLRKDPRHTGVWWVPDWHRGPGVTWCPFNDPARIRRAL